MFGKLNLKNILCLNHKQALSTLCSLPAHARFETHDFANQQMEDDYGVLVKELRCLVCQMVYKKLSEGMDKGEIVDFMVQRYGDFVIYRPPIKTSTFLLWFGPLIFFGIAAVQTTSKGVEINEDKQKKAHSLLDDDE